MADIELKVRNIKTYETLVACFPTEEDAVGWLTDRPAFMEVLGTPPSQEPNEELDARLRAALRPFDDEEKAFMKAQKLAEEEAAQKAFEEEQAQAQAAHEARVEWMKTADPDRPMVVSWTLEEGFSNGEADDPREVTEVARKAAEAWIAERNTWVSSPRVVGEAKITVWPGKVPSGAESDRVHSGSTFQAVFPPDAAVN